MGGDAGPDPASPRASPLSQSIGAEIDTLESHLGRLQENARTRSVNRKEIAMYGTIFRLQPKAGREQDVVSLMEEWSRDRGSQVQGARATYLLQSERRPGELVGVAVFDDEQTYRANADSLEQDTWYQRLREALEADPVWEDGTYLVPAQMANTGA
jgi:hypothetical protein